MEKTALECVEDLLVRNPIMMTVFEGEPVFGELQSFAQIAASARNSDEPDWIDALNVIEALNLVNTDHL